MKTVGIVGGIGPESTIAYYRRIIASYRKRKPDGSYPSIIIDSIDLKRLLDLVGANELAALSDYASEAVLRLVSAGADFAVFASNTPHIVFDEVRRRSLIPLISIVEETCKAAKLLEVKKAGLLGAAFTMGGRFYPEVFSREGMTIVAPQLREQEYIHEKYMQELVPGVFLPETKARLLEIVGAMKEREGIDAVILGGTELPLILSVADGRDLGIPFLDTCQIHVDAIVAELLSNQTKNKAALREEQSQCPQS